MSTSDRHEQGPLTRKQLREIRLTGSTPVVPGEEGAGAVDAAPPAPPLPRPAEPVEVAPAPTPDADVDLGSAPLTRRQAREQERIRTASVPVIGGQEPAETPDPQPDAPVEIVSGIPEFSRPSSDEEAPPSALPAGEGVREHVEETRPADETDHDDAVADDDSDAVETPARDVDEEEELAEAERPTVSPTFGKGVLADAEEPSAPFRPSFDDLLSVGDSTGSQHTAPSALIFTPGEGSLSGPVASTGEILVTGSYELPKGLGSQGHAHGTTDGKEVDAVLIDGELPPASSPTPIAASSAVSTIKPAGEVIRPPAPEKGNRLMMILAIVAGGLALALGVILVVAFTMNVF